MTSLTVEGLKALLDNLGTTYSEVLGIDLSRNSDEEIFKWFLASVLFGAPITESAAVKTYRGFETNGLLTPKRIIETGWDGLVKVLDAGGYTRYDFKTADKLLLVMKNLVQKYGGSLCNVCRESGDSQALEGSLKNLGKGIGDVTVGIFLRELRGIWRKADPDPSPLVVEAARRCGIISRVNRKATSLTQLKSYWNRHRLRGYSYVNFETALLRLGKDFLRKGKEPDFLG